MGAGRTGQYTGLLIFFRSRLVTVIHTHKLPVSAEAESNVISCGCIKNILCILYIHLDISQTASICIDFCFIDFCLQLCRLIRSPDFSISCRISNQLIVCIIGFCRNCSRLIGNLKSCI